MVGLMENKNGTENILAKDYIHTWSTCLDMLDVTIADRFEA